MTVLVVAEAKWWYRLTFLCGQLRCLLRCQARQGTSPRRLAKGGHDDGTNEGITGMIKVRQGSNAGTTGVQHSHGHYANVKWL